MEKMRRGFRDARVARLAEDFLVFCSAVEPRLVRAHRGANDQFQEAAASLVANVGEGLDEVSVGDKRRFYRYALRSAGECERLLRSLARLEALPPGKLEEGLRRLLAVKHDLIRLIRWTRSAGKTR